MSSTKNSKSKLWIYALILFTSAFIVLLLTAYSQIKLNKSIVDYRSQISSIEKENSKFEVNLNSTLNLNRELSKKIKELNKEIEDSNGKLAESEQKYNKLGEKYKSVLSSYEILIKAQTEYNNDNYLACALLLKNNCDVKDLQKEAFEQYEYLIQNSYVKAAHKLYIDGYKEYRDKNYVNAIEKFKQSLEFTGNEYFSDDALFLTAYSYYYSDNKDLARDTLNKFVKKYPESSYFKEAEKLLEIMNH